MFIVWLMESSIDLLAQYVVFIRSLQPAKKKAVVRIFFTIIAVKLWEQKTIKIYHDNFKYWISLLVTQHSSVTIICPSFGVTIPNAVVILTLRSPIECSANEYVPMDIYLSFLERCGPTSSRLYISFIRKIYNLTSNTKKY